MNLLFERDLLEGVDGLAIAHGLLNGFRFDLLVVGFIFIPVVVVSWWGGPFPLWRRIVKSYLALVWMGALAVYFVDSIWFVKAGQRFRYQDLQEFFRWPFQVHLYGLLIVATGSVGLLTINDEAPSWVTAPFGKAENLIRFLAPILLVAFMARGTVGQYHLRREHSFVSTSERFNEWVLSPLWTLDK